MPPPVCKEKTMGSEEKHERKKAAARKYSRKPSIRKRRKVNELKRKYNITRDEYIGMFEQQNYACGICNMAIKPFTKFTHVDHCHSTDKVRGILCMNCNNGLGKFKDNKERMMQAVLYLIEHEE
tara:strand:- start:163 stop:534 length:372 start_codon:yes stop_codon:yes gene_type:complete